jgi:hypothetical protein
MIPFTRHRVCEVVLLATVSTALGGCGSQPTEVVPLEKWSDRLGFGPPDPANPQLSDPNYWEALRRKAPANYFIADQQSWLELWRAWRGIEQVPAVDFQTEIVLVYTCDGPNYVQVRLERDGSGNVKCTQMRSTALAGMGFGYVMLRINRTGINAVEGHPIRLEIA